jgi:Domain of unknown function (DUF5655)
MARWICPRCDREFVRARQAHTCVPGGTVDDSFAGRPPVQREIYDAVVEHLHNLGPVHADAVKVGVFLKRQSKLAEARPMATGLALSIVLPRWTEHERVTRHMRISGDRIAHMVKLKTVADVDEQILGWLTEAYEAAG